jgi:hypothetical protein
MAEVTTYEDAFWRGIIIGPLAVLPGVLIPLIIISIARYAQPQKFMGIDEPIQLLASITGVFLLFSLFALFFAYVIVVTYGAIVWLVLLKLGILSLKWMLCFSVLPWVAVGISFFGHDKAGLALGGAYFSILVCALSWYVGLRKLETHNKKMHATSA